LFKTLAKLGLIIACIVALFYLPQAVSNIVLMLFLIIILIGKKWN